MPLEPMAQNWVMAVEASEFDSKCARIVAAAVAPRRIDRLSRFISIEVSGRICWPEAVLLYGFWVRALPMTLLGRITCGSAMAEGTRRGDRRDYTSSSGGLTRGWVVDCGKFVGDNSGTQSELAAPSAPLNTLA